MPAKSAFDVQQEIVAKVRAEIPEELLRCFGDLSFAGMAELSVFADWRNLLLDAEREWSESEQ